MKRAFLTELGVEETLVEKIMAEHGRTTQSLQAELETTKTQLSSANATLGEANKQIEAFKSMDFEGVKQAADDWKNRAETAQKESDAKIKALQFDFALERALTTAKVKDPRIIAPLLKTDALKLSDDGIVGLKEQLDPLMQSHAYLFDADDDPAPQLQMPTGVRPSQPDLGPRKGSAAQYEERLAAARKAGNNADAVAIKMQAASENIMLN
jgi:Phage minor structural protein GP20.